MQEGRRDRGGNYNIIMLHSALTQKLRRRITFVSFEGDIKLSVPGDLV